MAKRKTFTADAVQSILFRTKKKSDSESKDLDGDDYNNISDAETEDEEDTSNSSRATPSTQDINDNSSDTGTFNKIFCHIQQ